MTPEEFLPKATAAAHAAGHIFPEHAACEAALESAWGSSALAVRANNLFGQKQAHPPCGTSLSMHTREFLYGAWVTVPAEWMIFGDWQSCFAERMAVLQRLAGEFPQYRAALAAKTGEQFVAAVSQRWSTDPQRAAKVLSVFHKHFAGSQVLVA